MIKWLGYITIDKASSNDRVIEVEYNTCILANYVWIILPLYF